MNNFTYARANDLEIAVAEISSAENAKYIGGGTNLLDLMKENVSRPDHLIDISRLPFSEIKQNEAGGLRLGAMVSNADTAWNELVEKQYPILSKAILAGASPQLRNMATDGGNLMQRTRCYYFYDLATPCNKRNPGSGCSAINGYNRIHAILGTSEACIATHPSDMCVALAALEATVLVEGKAGKRSIPFADFHRLPGDTPELDNNLKPDEVITHLDLPAKGFADNFAYLKVRDRASYAFAIVSVAAALEITDGKLTDVRLAMGGVAHKPWRDAGAEQSLIGKIPSKQDFAAAADIFMAEAKGFGDNTFKIELGKRAIVRALSEAAKLD